MYRLLTYYVTGRKNNVSRLDSPCLATPKWQALSTPQTNVGPMCSPICSFHSYVTADTKFFKKLLKHGLVLCGFDHVIWFNDCSQLKTM